MYRFTLKLGYGLSFFLFLYNSFCIWNFLSYKSHHAHQLVLYSNFDNSSSDILLFSFCLKQRKIILLDIFHSNKLASCLYSPLTFPEEICFNGFLFSCLPRQFFRNILVTFVYLAIANTHHTSADAEYHIL